MIVSFCGHNRFPNSAETEQWLTDVVSDLIEQGATHFYLGGYGGFDRLALRVMKKQKKLHPNIQYILVLAYLNRARDVEEAKDYDSTIYPPLESVPLRLAIVRRNAWMAEVCDVMVARVDYDWGGAATTLAHARQKKKCIILYLNYNE